MVLVRTRLEAELLARAVVQNDDFAPDLGPLGDRGGPGHNDLVLLITNRVDPGATELIESRHGRSRGSGVREGVSDEQAVVGVVVVHVVQNGRHDVV